jgi:hypothetical protein
MGSRVQKRLDDGPDELATFTSMYTEEMKGGGCCHCSIGVNSLFCDIYVREKNVKVNKEHNDFFGFFFMIADDRFECVFLFRRTHTPDPLFISHSITFSI